MKFLNKNRGFTLIELLVVITILGLLAGLVVSNMAGARERARDAKRKSDLKEIQKALEMYKQDQATPSYPPNDLSPLQPDYIKIVPADPLEDLNYTYVRTAILDYTLKACLENKSDPQAVEDQGCSTGYKYEVTAP